MQTGLDHEGLMGWESLRNSWWYNQLKSKHTQHWSQPVSASVLDLLVSLLRLLFFFWLFILVTVAGEQQCVQVTFCSDNVELTWTEADLKVLCSREYRYKTVRTSLLISVSKINAGLTPLSDFTPVETPPPIFLTSSSSSHLSLASSALPLKGLKPALGDAGLDGEA